MALSFQNLLETVTHASEPPCSGAEPLEDSAAGPRSCSQELAQEWEVQ